MRPGGESAFGPTDWTRNVLAVTGACLAIRRELFDQVGGFDERFVLCGSDVVLGLDMVLRGKRNVVTADTRIKHMESATRGTDIPRMDFFTSFWRYNPWLFGGDPYYSPNLSLNQRTPTLKSTNEPTVAQRIGPILGHNFEVFRQQSSPAESRFLADLCHALPADEAAVNALHAKNSAPLEIKSVNWFIPGVDSPFYGGINTMLRIADKLARDHGVLNRFVTFGEPNEDFIRSAVAAPFPALQNSEVAFYRVDSNASLELVPYADASVATLWLTAYAVTHFPHTKRKFYLMQDYEPGFFPNGTEFGLAEETYNLGLYGLCNTENLRNVYRDEYGGKSFAFSPAVDDRVFHARWRHQRTPDAPATVFLYARPGMWRNCWEMAAPALEELKRRQGDRVRIVAAGAWAIGAGAEADVKRLGLLDYTATGELYRNCDIGMALTLSRHPSYLPLELMACGVPVVAFDNPWGHWLLRDGENSLLSKRTADSLTDRLEKLVVDPTLRKRLAGQGLADIAAHYSDWDKALSGIYGYLCDPEGHLDDDPVRQTLTTIPVVSQ
jgi:glycosyltransferase involved in cell wall biosynthesis